MSIEEKQAKLLDWFQAEHTMYNIKEIETQASKKTGISSMQIKDVLKMLIDEGLVSCEKCGIANIYWSFKYTAAMRLGQEYERAVKAQEDGETALEMAMAQLNLMRSERTMSGKAREQLMEKASKLETEVKEFEATHEKLLDNTPEKVEKRRERVRELEEKVEEIVDNLDILVSYIVKSSPNGVTAREVREHFDIPVEDEE